MKRKFYLPLLLLPFITGCGVTEQPLNKIISYVENLAETNINTFSAETEGVAFGNDLTMKNESKTAIKTSRDMTKERSCLFGVPLKLDIENFYSEYDDGSIRAKCQFSKIKYQLVDVCPTSPSKTPLQSEFLEDGSIKFWAVMSNNRLENLGHFINTEEYDGVDPYTRAPVDVFSGKLDGCYIYDKDGYLTFEEFKTHDQNGPTNLTADARCYYHYYE